MSRVIVESGVPRTVGTSFPGLEKGKAEGKSKGLCQLCAENVTFVHPEDTKHACGEGQSHGGISLKNVLVFILFFNTRLISSESLVKRGCVYVGWGVG